MKKILGFALLCTLSAALFAETITMTKVAGKFKDDIVVVNKSLNGDIAVNISIKVEGDFENVKDVELAFFDDELLIHSKEFPNKIKPKTITQVQVTPLTEVEYVCKATIEKDNLVIEIRDPGSDLRKSVIPSFDNNPDAYTFDGRTIADVFDENLKLKNQTNLDDISFKISVYDSKNHKWITYGSAELNGRNDVSKVKTKLDLEDYRYFAIEAQDGQKYTYMPVEDDSDLIINVSL